MGITDIIPDIHGQAEKLSFALRSLGWRRTSSRWTHPEPDRQVLFLGDFIDRGPANGAVIRMVRELVDSGRARAVMGNHELNAIHFHTLDPDTGRPLRKRDDRNVAQHQSFLDEFPIGAPETNEVIGWMRGLPLFIEEPHFRAVHAAWIDTAINRLRSLTGDGTLSEEQFIRSARADDEMFNLTETIAKGPEHKLPDGFFFNDKQDSKRKKVRLRWWGGNAKTWRDVAMSVPDMSQLPDTLIPPSIMTSIYPSDERPVFFGHYWMSGAPVLQGDNTVCLDYSAGRDGPLVSYAMPSSIERLRLEDIHVHRP